MPKEGEQQPGLDIALGTGIGPVEATQTRHGGEGAGGQAAGGGAASSLLDDKRRLALVAAVVFALYLTGRLSMSTEARTLRHRFGRVGGSLAWIMANPIDSLFVLSPLAYAAAPYLTSYSRTELLDAACVLRNNRHMDLSEMVGLLERRSRDEWDDIKRDF